MYNEGTIIALSSPPGSGAIAIIRLSGEKAISKTDIFFKSKSGKKLKHSDGYSISYGDLVEGDEVIDEVVVCVYKAPHSYTGENIIEISCHGSNYIQQRIISLFTNSGVRLANPGEFTLRAYLNNKKDLSQAEAVSDLIASESKEAHRIAMEQMRGGYSDEIEVLREKLIHFKSLIELELDFSEEDVEFADKSDLKSLLNELESKLSSLIESFSYGNVIKEGVTVTIAGKPNAGKSSLLNAIVNEDKAIVSDIPGTTRDAIEDVTTINGIKFRFIDTAGIRETSDKIESIGVEKAKSKIGTSRILIYLFDRLDITEKEIIKEGVTVTIAGKPNAGKSSLLNAIVNEDKAIVSDIPGTTRDAIEDVTTINGIKFRFIDTAGIRETSDKIESIGVEKAKSKIGTSRILIYLFDRSDITEKELIKEVKSYERDDLQIYLVENKIDVLKYSDTDSYKENIKPLINQNNITFHRISALNIDLVSELKEMISKNLNLSSQSNIIISNSRHLEALNNSLKAIDSVKSGLKDGLSGDLLSIDLNDAIINMSIITGKIDIDQDILGSIFSKFCIGK